MGRPEGPTLSTTLLLFPGGGEERGSNHPPVRRVTTFPFPYRKARPPEGNPVRYFGVYLATGPTYVATDALFPPRRPTRKGTH